MGNGKSNHVTMIFPPFLRLLVVACRFFVKEVIFAFAVYVEFSLVFRLHNKFHGYRSFITDSLPQFSSRTHVDSLSTRNLQNLTGKDFFFIASFSTVHRDLNTSLQHL